MSLKNIDIIAATKTLSGTPPSFRNIYDIGNAKHIHIPTVTFESKSFPVACNAVPLDSFQVLIKQNIIIKIKKDSV